MALKLHPNTVPASGTALQAHHASTVGDLSGYIRPAAASAGAYGWTAKYSNRLDTVLSYLLTSVNNLSGSAKTDRQRVQDALQSEINTDVATLSGSAKTDRQRIQDALQAEIDSDIASLVDSAPAALNTLNELAAAMGDDAALSASLMTWIRDINVNAGVLTSTVTTNSGSAKTDRLRLRDLQQADDNSVNTNQNSLRATLSGSAKTDRQRIQDLNQALIATAQTKANGNAAGINSVWTALSTLTGSGGSAPVFASASAGHSLSFGAAGAPKMVLRILGDGECLVTFTAVS